MFRVSCPVRARVFEGELLDTIKRRQYRHYKKGLLAAVKRRVFAHGEKGSYLTLSK